MCYCIWCTSLVLLDVVGSSCGALRCTMPALRSALNMFRASLCPSSGEQRPCVIAYGVLHWFCWMWLVVVVGRCVVGCEHCEVLSTCFGHHYAHLQQNKDHVLLHMVYCTGSAGCAW